MAIPHSLPSFSHPSRCLGSFFVVDDGVGSDLVRGSRKMKTASIWQKFVPVER